MAKKDKPSGVAKAAQDRDEQQKQLAAAAVAEHQHRRSLARFQNAKAREVRMRNLARKNPLVRELHQENATLRTTVDELRTQLASSSSAQAQLHQENATLQETAADLRKQLEAALVPKPPQG